MKNLIIIIIFMFSIHANAQRILAHTTTIGKFDNSSIKVTEWTDGKSEYHVYLASKIGLDGAVKSNVEIIRLDFDTKEKMINCLQYLYNFDKGDGYFIDLETKSKNTVTTVKYDRFLIGAFDQIDRPIVSKWTIGKLLNSIGVSVINNKDIEQPENEKNNKKQKNNMDDLYTQPNALY